MEPISLEDKINAFLEEEFDNEDVFIVCSIM